MEATFDAFIRKKANENSYQIELIKKRIGEEIEAKFHKEITLLREENEKFWEEEKLFHEAAYQIVVEAYNNDKTVVVQTQVGKNGCIINSYTGKIDKLYVGTKCFNLVDPVVYSGNPFTIGLSCLLSIKIID